MYEIISYTNNEPAEKAFALVVAGKDTLLMDGYKNQKN